jgi:hypothetical protein
MEFGFAAAAAAILAGIASIAGFGIGSVDEKRPSRFLPR